MRRLSLLGLLILTLSPLCLRATEERVIQNIDFDWYFYPADIQGCEMDNSRFLSWRKVDVPHDYSIEGIMIRKMAVKTDFCRVAVSFGIKKSSNGILCGKVRRFLSSLMEPI